MESREEEKVRRESLRPNLEKDEKRRRERTSAGLRSYFLGTKLRSTTTEPFSHEVDDFLLHRAVNSNSITRTEFAKTCIVSRKTVFQGSLP